MYHPVTSFVLCSDRIRRQANTRDDPVHLVAFKISRLFFNIAAIGSGPQKTDPTELGYNTNPDLADKVASTVGEKKSTTNQRSVLGQH